MIIKTAKNLKNQMCKYKKFNNNTLAAMQNYLVCKKLFKNRPDKKKWIFTLLLINVPTILH